MIDVHGQHNFSKAIDVAKQVFNTLTEYIQVSKFPFPLGITTSALWLLLVEMFLEIKVKQFTLSMFALRAHVLETSRV